jgi:hypothetical protein
MNDNNRNIKYRSFIDYYITKSKFIIFMMKFFVKHNRKNYYSILDGGSKYEK